MVRFAVAVKHWFASSDFWRVFVVVELTTYLLRPGIFVFRQRLFRRVKGLAIMWGASPDLGAVSDLSHAPADGGHCKRGGHECSGTVNLPSAFAGVRRVFVVRTDALEALFGIPRWRDGLPDVFLGVHNRNTTVTGVTDAAA
jgi:hypothetical protein